MYKRSVTNNNTSINTNGKFQNCFQFNSNSRIILPNEVLTNRINKDWTVDFWLYRSENINDTVIFGSWDFNSNSIALLVGTGTTIRVVSYASGEEYPVEFQSFQCPFNQWNHIAITNQNYQITIYKDGVKQMSANHTAYRSGTKFYLNYKGDTGSYSRCMIDEFRVSDIVRYNSNFQVEQGPYS